ncbi:YceK/YidQ family lipoprotein [Methylomonas sp. MV1]|uniref:YceK/YidQ family lipoprotein n=1 Tax=Methylomonas sp. MV1 TaxID=3073620 RepID=UPI0028A46B0B|nr:YceK/YidQ family lipoprotein [Methylomonas sp. MV1]MDT4329076.1 YceK/YidQ family lipoprotein [Methylomonas sp. MV1]
MKTFENIVICVFCSMGLSGCATFKSLNAEVPLYERVFIYCGTRLDWAALENDNATIRKLKTEAPRYPLVDLPFSFAMDSVFLPLAISAEIFH